MTAFSSVVLLAWRLPGIDSGTATPAPAWVGATGFRILVGLLHGAGVFRATGLCALSFHRR